MGALLLIASVATACGANNPAIATSTASITTVAPPPPASVTVPTVSTTPASTTTTITAAELHTLAYEIGWDSVWADTTMGSGLIADGRSERAMCNTDFVAAYEPGSADPDDWIKGCDAAYVAVKRQGNRSVTRGGNEDISPYSGNPLACNNVGLPLNPEDPVSGTESWSEVLTSAQCAAVDP